MHFKWIIIVIYILALSCSSKSGAPTEKTVSIPKNIINLTGPNSGALYDETFINKFSTISKLYGEDFPALVSLYAGIPGTDTLTIDEMIRTISYSDTSYNWIESNESIDQIRQRYNAIRAAVLRPYNQAVDLYHDFQNIADFCDAASEYVDDVGALVEKINDNVTGEDIQTIVGNIRGITDYLNNNKDLIGAAIFTYVACNWISVGLSIASLLSPREPDYTEYFEAILEIQEAIFEALIVIDRKLNWIIDDLQRLHEEIYALRFEILDNAIEEQFALEMNTMMGTMDEFSAKSTNSQRIALASDVINSINVHILNYLDIAEKKYSLLKEANAINSTKLVINSFRCNLVKRSDVYTTSSAVPIMAIPQDVNGAITRYNSFKNVFIWEKKTSEELLGSPNILLDDLNTRRIISNLDLVLPTRFMYFRFALNSILYTGDELIDHNARVASVYLSYFEPLFENINKILPDEIFNLQDVTSLDIEIVNDYFKSKTGNNKINEYTFEWFDGKKFIHMQFEYAGSGGGCNSSDPYGCPWFHPVITERYFVIKDTSGDDILYIDKNNYPTIYQEIHERHENIRDQLKDHFKPILQQAAILANLYIFLRSHQ